MSSIHLHVSICRGLAVAENGLADFDIAKFTAGSLFPGAGEDLYLVGCRANEARETARQCWRYDILNGGLCFRDFCFFSSLALWLLWLLWVCGFCGFTMLYLSTYLSIYLFIYLSIYLSVYLSIYLT